MASSRISDATLGFIDDCYAGSIVPALCEYIRIPNKSPAFDPDWHAHGHMARAVALLAEWARARLPPGATLEVLELPKRTPVIFIEVPGSPGRESDTVLLYGHLDKQPEIEGWRSGLGPWTPVLEGDRLYGRGGADDGYSLFASLTALSALHRDGIPHARAVILIEACEESGSYDLPAYIEHLSARIGELSLVVCLDSGCANYEQLWCTTSLRGGVFGTLEVSLLGEGVHSGDGTGVVADSFRVARALLERIEDSRSGDMLLPELSAPIPEARQRQAARAAAALGGAVWQKFPYRPGARPISYDPLELILNRTFRPGLTVTGAEGFPPLATAGNVLRASSKLKLSIRTPPGVDGDAAFRAVKGALESDPPYGAEVRFDGAGSTGWDAPELAPWLERALDDASLRHFGKPAISMGEGGGIPFMTLLGERYPRAQFCVTGVLGPGSNAHGPNEFLHLPTARRLTACVADVLAVHASR